MSPDRNFPQFAIEPDPFTRALDSGALDACLHSLRQERGDDCDHARRYCRLGEIFYHHGRSDDALECGRRAFAAAANDNDIDRFCAWLFSNCGCHQEAAAAYRRLIARNPDWVEGYRHASGSLAAVGDIETAIEFGIAASDLAPRRFEFAVHVGSLLLGRGQHAEAARYLRRAVALEPDDPRALRGLAAAFLGLKHPDEALALAERAAALAPGDADLVIETAELQLRAGHRDAAAAMLTAATRDHRDNPRLWRVLSGAEGERGQTGAALAAIDRALALAPDAAEYHLHRAHLLYGIGDYTRAADAFRRAAELDPGSAAGKRAQIGSLLAGGDVTGATAAGGELLRAFPEDDDAAGAVLRVLNRRLDTIEGDYVVLGERTARPPRAPGRAPGFGERLMRQARVVYALMIRETRTRFGESRLGYGWALLEPVLHIAMLSAVFSLLMRGRPPIGTQFFIFYYTGLIPYHVFVHTSTSMTHAITSNGSLLQLPLVTNFDVILARGLLEFATDIVVAAMLLAGFAAFSLPALPDDVFAAATALIVVAVLGCGAGFVNAVLQVLFKSWDKLWVNATRLLYFFSGIFYVPGMMPDWARDILVWNPVLQAVDWFRAGFFSAYQPHWLDRTYLAAFAIAALALGMALEAGLRRRLREPA